MRFRYQATIFGNYAFAKAEPKEMAAVMSRLVACGIETLIPSTVQEINPPNLTPQHRMRFASESGEDEILIGSTRLDVVKTSLDPDGEGLGGVDQFLQFCDHCLQAAIPSNPRIGSRLAFVQQEMSPQISPEKFDANYHKFFNAIPFFESASPSEWTFRSNKKKEINFGSQPESGNFIVKIERAQGLMVRQGVQKEFDRIISEIDINTVVELSQPRFGFADALAFFNVASSEASKLSAELNSAILLD